MNHRPRTGGDHTAPLVRHPARPNWAALRPHRPTTKRVRALLSSTRRLLSAGPTFDNTHLI